MRLDRKLVEFNLETPKTNVYVCQSTTNEHKDSLEISGNFNIVIFDGHKKKELTANLIYLTNVETKK